jgi:hypothetical protein
MKNIGYYLLCLLLFLSCSKAGTNKNTAYTNSASSVIVTQKSLEHIIDRHWSTSGAEGAGKFVQGTSTEDLREMIEITATKGRYRPNTNGRPGKIAEYNFEKVIGTTINGSPASRLRVVIAPDSYVITAFPY